MQAEIASLREAFRGTITLPDDAAFKTLTKTWSKSPVRPVNAQPAVVLSPRGTQDVVTALKFVQAQGLQVAVKSGGHCPRSSCVPHGGVVLDLSLMRSVFVDPIKRTAVAEGGCLLDDIDIETGLHGLMVPLGHAPVTGMGLVVNGGFGVATKTYGATCDHLVAVQLVTAAGQVVTADADHHPDLFWALRGAGSAFGVITKLTFRLNEVGDTFYGGLMLWQDDPEHRNFVAIASFIRDKSLPNPNFSMNVVRLVHPHMGPALFSMIMYFGPESISDKAAFLAPMRALNPHQDTVGKGSYADVQRAGLPMLLQMPEHYEYWANAQLTKAQVTNDVLAHFAKEVFDKQPIERLPLSMYLFDSFHGELVRKSKSPIGMTQADLFFGIMTGWLDAAHNEEGIAFAKRCKQTLRDLDAETDTYSNMVSEVDGGGDAALAACVGGTDNLARLRALKAEWDCNNIFCNTPFQGL